MLEGASTALRVGLVGLGNRGLSWVDTLHAAADVELVAVSEPVEGLLSRGRQYSGLTEEDCFSDTESLLARQDIDAVVVVVEPNNLARLSMQALRAGKHVLSEVPAAVSLDDCQELVRTVEESGKVYALAEQASYSAFANAWRNLVERGRLGKVLYGEAQYFHGVAANRLWHDSVTGERITAEQAHDGRKSHKSRIWEQRHPIWYVPHSLAPLLYALDTSVVNVVCLGTSKPGYVHPEMDLPDFEVALMRTTDDSILRIATCFTAPSAEPNHWHHLFGTNGEVETGRLSADPYTPTNAGALSWFGDDYQRSRTVTDWEFTDYKPGSVSDAAGLAHGGLDILPLEDFVSAVRTDVRPRIDVYRACEIAAAGIVAGMSAEQDGVQLDVPRYRPGAANKDLGAHASALAPHTSSKEK